MMGNRGAGNGDEHDAFSRGWRRLIFWKRGELKKIKRRFSKRQRRGARAALAYPPDAE